MPTYEYRCKGCGRHLEVVQAFTDASLTQCEQCGGELRKVFGSVGISFKGSGFYKTDSRGGTKVNGSSSSKEKSSDSSSSSTDSGSSTNGSSSKGDGSSAKGKGTSDKSSSSSKSPTSSGSSS